MARKKKLEEEGSEEPSNKQINLLQKTLNLFEEKCKTAKVAIFTHGSPDPDAIASMMSLSWLLTKQYEAEVDCYYDGQVSHPQNQRFCNLLDPDLKEIQDYNDPGYSLFICVDTIPSNCVCPPNINFNLVIDHHKDPPNGTFKGVYLNLKAGSCCSTIYQLIKALGVSFEEDNEIDSKIATSILVGIITDTEYQTSDDTTEYEHEAYRELFDFRNSEALRQITRYKHPKEWVQARAAVALKAHDNIKDGVLVHGIGFLTSNNRNLISAVADEMLSWENVETAVAFAIIDGAKIEGSVRSSNAALAVPSLCKDLGGAGNGGGKLGKGAYNYSLGCLACDDDDSGTKEKMWEYINDREGKRILKILKRQ